MNDLLKNISSFDSEQFHFLRPEWLWAFVPVVLVLVIVIFSNREDTKWKRMIAPALREFMFTKAKRSAFVFPLISYVIIMSIGIISLSGPAWEKIEVPGAKTEAVLMIALDVSMSMLAKDIQPNRLERAKFKIRDLLKANPGARVSLFAYAGTAHPVVPICSDYKLITHHLESLAPGIMPVQGSNLSLMLNLADSILQKIAAPSTLLIVSDVIEEKEQLKTFVDNTPHSIEILAMATRQGAPVPSDASGRYFKDESGNQVISRLDTKILFELQEHPKIHINTLTLDESDVEGIAKKVREKLEFQEDAERSDEEWEDMGYLLVVLLVLIVPFWFRKGWMIQYCLLLIMLSSCTSSTSWDDIWKTPDYQAQKLYKADKFDEAADKYVSPIHRGVAHYKAGNYDAAVFAFAQDSSAPSLYNLSLSHTQMGNYEEALKAIELAAKIDPGNKAFQKAITQTRELMNVVDSLKQLGEPILLPEETKEEKGELKERKAASKDEELSSDTEVEELPEEGERVTDEVETATRKAKELTEVPEDFQSGEGQSPQDILLREISDDPAEFLKRRFEYQYKKYYQNIQAPKEKW